MKDNIKKNIQSSMICLDIIFFIYTIIIFILKEMLMPLVYPITASFFMLLTFFSVLFLGFQQNKKNRAKARISNTILIISTLYLITIYLAGNATGFLKTEFNFLNTAYLLIYFGCAEIFRYVFFNKCTKNSIHPYVITLCFVLLDILVLSNFSPTNTLNIATLITITAISLMKNGSTGALCSLPFPICLLLSTTKSKPSTICRCQPILRRSSSLVWSSVPSPLP